METIGLSELVGSRGESKGKREVVGKKIVERGGIQKR